MVNVEQFPYVLGLDVGADSVGWTILPCAGEEEGETGQPKVTAIKAVGARIFEAGMEGDLASGKEESRAKPRREKRLQRRQANRRAMRTFQLFTLLQKAGLIPPFEKEVHGRLQQRAARDALLTKLDQELLSSWQQKLKSEGASPEELRLLSLRFPYVLRARALDHKLEPYELGRAIYHLGQRRGFLSNRKAQSKKDEEQGKVKTGIKQLSEEMGQTGARTLGEYFSRLNPEEARLRHRWTSRAMYLDEFNQIWSAQIPHHPALLTEKLKAEIQDTIFHQRPLKIQSHLIGECEFEKGKKRAPVAILAFQRFRILQVVNNLRVIENYQARPLTQQEREKLIAALEGHGNHLDEKGNLSLKKAKEHLELSSKIRFNFEKGEKSQIVGNHTAHKLRKIFGDRWDKFSDAERDQIVEDILSIQSNEALKKRGMNKWGLDEAAAQELAECELEAGHRGLSRQALAKLIPLMEKGLTYMEAVNQTYDPAPPEPQDLLPPVKDALKEIRNPAVMRSLTEMRKVVNAIIRQYGKPQMIRVELVRELKKPKKEREEISKAIAQNQQAREEAKKEIESASELNITEAKRRDQEKLLLWKECNGICPYTGRPISMKDLFSGMVQVEHIIPRHRGRREDSFVNKTLCWADENLKKHNRTPWEAYGSDPKRWEEIIARVKKFQPLSQAKEKKSSRKGKTKGEDHYNPKLRRFLMKEEELKELEKNFTDRQLNDTAYASRLARKYLDHLYGSKNGVDEAGKLRIQVSAGQVTAHIRNLLGLNRLLDDGGQKTREDHRHHAVDAIAIALTTPAMVKRLSDAESKARPNQRPQMEPPWPNFLNDAKNLILNTVVSHRPSRKVSGQLHEETIYSPPRTDDQGKTWVHVRKPLAALTPNEVDEIADSTVKKLVQEKLTALNEKNPKKAFTNPENLPFLIAKAACRKIPIRKVRLRKSLSTFPVGDGPRQRFVTTGANHHLEIYEVTDKKGNPKWEGKVVDMLTALRRLKNGEPVVQRDHGPTTKFVFSLAGGDIIEIDEPDGRKGLYRIRTITTVKQGANQYPRVEFIHINDARMKNDIQKAGDWIPKLLEPLRKLNCRKVSITPLGEVRPAND